MLRSIQVEEVYTVPSLLNPQEGTPKCEFEHPWFFFTLAPTCLADFWMAHFSESSHISQKWLLSVNFYSQTPKKFARQSQNHLLGNNKIQYRKSHPEFLMRQECKGAKSACNLHFVLLWPHLDFTKIWKNHPGTHWRQTPQTNEPEWQTHVTKTSFATSPSSFPRKPSQPGTHWKPGHGLQPREMTTKLRCVMVPSRGTETAKAAFSVQISQTRHQNKSVTFYRAWSSKSTREFRDDLQPTTGHGSPHRSAWPGPG